MEMDDSYNFDVNFGHPMMKKNELDHVSTILQDSLWSFFQNYTQQYKKKKMKKRKWIKDKHLFQFGL